MKTSFKRVLLKLSGEAFLSGQDFGVNFQAIQEFSSSIKELVDLGVEVAVVVGGGNFVRGAALSKQGFNQVTCDHVGMLATVMNGILFRDGLVAVGVAAHVMSAVSIAGVAERYDRCLADNYLKKNNVVIFVGGTGAPLFTTDSAAALRSIEINADILLKATKVDGVYSADPKINKSAKLFEELTYDQILDKQLAVMDLTAILLCKKHNKKIRVFNMNKKNVLKNIILGEKEGTGVSK